MALLPDSPRQAFKRFGIGFALFFAGLGLVAWAEFLAPPSLRQELAALTGLGVAALGFATAMTGQFALVWLRLKRFFQD